MQQKVYNNINEINVKNPLTRLNEALKAYSEALRSIKGSVSGFYEMSKECQKYKL